MRINLFNYRPQYYPDPEDLEFLLKIEGRSRAFDQILSARYQMKGRAVRTDPEIGVGRW